MAETTIRRILIATDGTEGALQAARYAAPLAKSMGAAVALVHVAPPTLASGGPSQLAIETPEAAAADDVDLARAIWEGTQAILDRTREPFDRLGVAVEGLIREGEVAEEILRIAGEEDFDLIVVASHGGRNASRTRLGSTSSALVKEAPCPVLVVRGL